MQLKHVYWFSHYNMDAPSTRYRAKYALESLREKYGIAYSFVTPGYQLKNLANFGKVFFLILFFRKKNSLIVFQRIYTRGFYYRILKLLLLFRRKKTAYDLDDAEYLNYPPQTIHYFMKNCSACTVGSSSLFQYATKYNSNVFLLTSPVIKHDKIKIRRNKLLTIGWIGFYNTNPDNFDKNAHKKNMYRLFFPALLNINFKLKIVILGITLEEDKKELLQYFSQNKNIVLDMPDNINWHDEQSIYEKISEFDIGVSPLLDNECNRAKSAFKLKQYLSCGVPALASPVGENCKFLKNGLNGFLCENSDDFYDKICHIKNLDELEYTVLSDNALQSVNSFSLDFYCDQLLTLYGKKTIASKFLYTSVAEIA